MDEVELELECAVYGEASVFPVKIARDAKVSALQEAIAGVVSTEQHAVPPLLVTLYLARKKEGDKSKWLKDDDSLDATLRGDIDKEYKEMRPSWKLNKPEYFGDFQLGQKVIHVLVELTEAAPGAASGSQGMKELIKAAVGELMDEREAKQSVHSLSDLNSELGARIMRKMRLREDCLDVDEPVDATIAGYQWIPNVAESEASQRAGYMTYLRLHLKTLLDRGDFQLVDIAQDELLLSTVDPRLPFRVNGTADVLLVNRRAKNPLNKLAGVRLVIELKKKVESSHLPQALGQLASCSLKAPLHCYPMSLLTDLNDRWHFSWFNQERVVAHVTLSYPKNAIDFIVAAVSEKKDSVPFRVPFISLPLKKLKVDDFLPMPSDGADEMMEQYELMADELEPEFLMERRMEYAQHLVQSMPMYAHMFA